MRWFSPSNTPAGRRDFSSSIQDGQIIPVNVGDHDAVY